MQICISGRGGRLQVPVKIKPEVHVKPATSGVGVANRARTGDPQNHNLML